MTGFPALSLLLLSLSLLLLASASVQQQVYIVYLGEHRRGEEKAASEEIERTHRSYLLSVKETEAAARGALVYSYKNSINGFAARLAPNEASTLSELEEVVSVFPSRPGEYSLHTTRSWEFAGLIGGGVGRAAAAAGGDMLARARGGMDAIVGVLDSGVWPESESFNDKGMGPIPTSWQGICQGGDGFNSSNCNRKLIGARYYLKGYEAYYGPLNSTIDYRSPRDKDGHGTHTTSTIGGRRVQKASAVGGFAAGTAMGGAPLARLSIYKVCWAIPGQPKDGENTCFMEDMLAAMDDAIADGVHVLSLSIGTSQPVPYAKDGIAIGALHALKHNVVVACSAGNAGPGPATLSNPAPWVITVAASSIDRAFPSPVVLGNGVIIPGQTITSYKLGKRMRPLVFAADVVSKDFVNSNVSGQCLPGTLSPEKTEGKLVLCLRGQGTRVGKGMEAKRAGAAGLILGNSPLNANEIAVDDHVLPATAVAADSATRILAYINSSTDKATATILPAKTVLHAKPAPFMAAFSSRGPNALDPRILKPDITAPGLNILAAWSEASSPTKVAGDKRVVKYNIMSGTSMSCPHVSAAAALIKAVHPTWSSAAVRSALMTTATARNNIGLPIEDASGNPADPFQYGAGHFQPALAADPGLVYDASYADYLLHLCALGVDTLDPSFNCPNKSSASTDLNYPSLAVTGLRGGRAIAKRTVTNVGRARCLYFSSVMPPRGFSVKISPRVLFFGRVGERKSFTIEVKADDATRSGREEGGEYAFGWYVWRDGTHAVRSSIAVSLA